jgi:hypothetical protein
MKAQQLACLLSAATMLVLASPRVHAFDLVIHASTLTKALKQQVFKNQGRYQLLPPSKCNDPYLENPEVTFKQGRIFIAAHFDGKIGASIGGVCKSVSEPSAVVLSARPVARAQQVGLEDVRIESAAEPLVGAALQNLIAAGAFSPLQVDLLASLRAQTTPEKTAPYALTVRALEVRNLKVQNDELRVTVDGAVDVR